MTNRLFLALNIPDASLKKLIDLRDKIYGAPNNVKWENKEKLHITVKFLGDVGENILDLILRRLEDIKFSKISSSFTEFGFFKKNGLLKILFAAVDDSTQIQEFYKIINDECELLGFKWENRKFKPHLTMLRIKNNENINRLIVFNKKKIDNIKFDINSFSILKSELKSGGSEYSIVKKINLI